MKMKMFQSPVPDVPEPSQNVSLAPEIINALEERKWLTVIEVCRIAKATAPDGEVRRLNEIADFALAIDSISRGNLPESADSLVTAARLLGAVSQPVHRSYAPHKLVEFGFTLIAASLSSEQGGGADGKLAICPDGTWAILLGPRNTFFHSLATRSLSERTLRIVEHLCAGAIGDEIAEKLWEAPTNTSEPGLMRADLLRFLHDQRLFEKSSTSPVAMTRLFGRSLSNCWSCEMWHRRGPI